MLLKLAWRNLWRNKRRTYITLGSVTFAVMLSTLMMSFKEGVYVNMIDSMVGAYSGYGQVHANGYWKDKNLDNGLIFNDTLHRKLQNTKALKGYMPRIEGFALTTSKDISKGALVVGIDPKKEARFKELHKRVKKGKYLKPEDKSILIGAGLAEYLKVDVGDTVVLLGRGYHGASAAGKYPIKGIVKFGSPELSKQLIFLPLKEAQWLYAAEGVLTNLILIPESPKKTDQIVQALENKLGNRYEVMNWQELHPELVSAIETDRMEGYIFMFILYMVISFGLFGTMLMMLAERKHEFGVLVAVGMKRLKLAWVVFLEVLSISILGALLGMLCVLPICMYFYYVPIQLGEEMRKMIEEYGMEAVIQTSLDPGIFIQQAAIVVLIVSLIAVYPFIKLTRMNVINAMRG
jgi:putative ABC transport system permease protein